MQERKLKVLKGLILEKLPILPTSKEAHIKDNSKAHKVDLEGFEVLKQKAKSVICKSVELKANLVGRAMEQDHIIDQSREKKQLNNKKSSKLKRLRALLQD